MPRRKKLPPRSRPRSLPVNSDNLSEHIATTLRTDLDDRELWNQDRLNRYAKMRGWRDPKNYPWDNSSNAHIPVLITDSLRTQDTLHNAILARHPVVEAMAVQQVNADKQHNIDNLLDYQLFEEQPGEEIIATLVQQYVEDGVFMAYVPWVRYDESVADVHTFPAIPDDLSIGEGVIQAMQSIFSVVDFAPIDKDGFRWNMVILENGEEYKVKVEAYITQLGGKLELVLHREVRAYDGPVVIPKSVDEWIVPWRAANEQPPSPSNPGGAEHVYLLDYPTLDEIRRLYYQNYYDVLTEDELDELTAATKKDPEQGEQNSALKELKDDLEGIQSGAEETLPEEVEGAGKLTRVQAFLGWDVNNDGLQEQIVVWMILETKTILRVRYLTEQYPSDPPLRPLASAGYLPVEGRMYAISLIELLESLHDLIKMSFDQMYDSATIKNLPWFSYRPASAMNPEAYKIAPGEGIPLADPKNDINILQFGTQGDAFGMNMLALLTQYMEKASMQGDIQFGRVPKGKASALRTASGMQNILSQGDARPERVMRRFFSGFRNVYRIMHELNQRFLPERKQFRLMEPDLQSGKAVYKAVDDVQNFSGRMQFVFTAGMFNTDKELAQQVMQTLMQTLINPMMLQLGIVGQQQILNLMIDFIKLLQREPSRYLQMPQEPDPTMMITAEEAVQLILYGRKPQGTTPAEGIEAHMKKIADYLQRPETELEINQFTQGIFQAYLADLQGQLQKQQQQQQLMQKAQEFQQSIGGGNGAQPGPQAQGPAPNAGVSGNAPLGQNELADETLPGAR